MNFANLTPAERMKASGLIGLIVVVVFFVVYTMMGALGGKKAPANAPVNTPDDTASVSAPGGPLSPNPSGPVDPSQPFPVTDAKNHQSTTENLDLYKLDADPFIPIRSKATPSAAAMSAMNHGQPNVSIMPAAQHNPLPPFGQPRQGLTPFGVNPFQSGGRPAEIEKPEPPKFLPEIQVVGVVSGQPSVATLRVEGHVITARPGDLLAKGHRLVAVNDEGVVIRSHGELTSLRVGAGVNNSKSALASDG